MPSWRIEKPCFPHTTKHAQYYKRANYCYRKHRKWISYAEMGGSQTQKSTCFVILLVWGSRISKSIDRKFISGCLGLGVGERLTGKSVSQFSHSIATLRPHRLQHTRPPCPSPTPGVYPNSCPLSQWCHPTISSSVVPFSSHLQSFPASGSFQMSHFFASGEQSIGVSASASVLPMNTQNWSPLGWIGWISFLSKGLSRVFSNNSSALSFLYSPTLTSIYNY